jgi:hypothetical protein
MMRTVCGLLVGLHPPAFRARFGIEMMCTFDEACGTQSALRLTLDAAASLFRQWLLRESVWKYPAALCAAVVVVAIGMRLPVPPPSRHHLQPETASAELFLLAALASVIAVSLTTIFCVFWFRMANRLRQRSTR